MSKLASVGLLLALLAPAEPALAVPHVYTDVVLGVDNLMACVENAKTVASKNGFTDDVQVTGTGKSRSLYADHASLPMALSISCSSQLGAVSIAVAGMNNDDTFAAFQKVYDDF
ncbi:MULTISPECIES: hypothetical protein [Cyanophyceae]|jgi:hypothetical protein|uniref:DUF3718 domain-containing protein n=1 Tax=Aphanothece cf. minutissima CCALA 015 TaxID=2107695 RepID=A0ABX5F5U4_9CHRO|nr:MULTISPECIES: hypothetical protein [Cyanophyceae]MCP9797017.1 hypothetical protein [Cyanobium sp. Lug-B]MCP9934115.1 hypothetical protein [Cyanobium sp. Candia 9D4]PSB36898.1 hypothetical protein C7B81_10740 [Aphanothece cf. minutissima CCALA 015]